MNKLNAAALALATALTLGHAAFAGTMSVPPVPLSSMYQTVADIQMKVWAAGGANLRAMPTTSSKILAKLPAGTTVTVIEKVAGGSWAHVKVNGLDGYIDSRLVE
jgi:uncharacterized protein YgiM (DUF1202 family)